MDRLAKLKKLGSRAGDVVGAKVEDLAIYLQQQSINIVQGSGDGGEVGGHQACKCCEEDAGSQQHLVCVGVDVSDLGVW